MDLGERIALPGASVVVVQCGADAFRVESGPVISAGQPLVPRVYADA